MIIIADSGSTKTDWCIIEPGGVKTFFQTSGLNPVIMGEDVFRQKLTEELVPRVMSVYDVYHIEFFGAGCTPEKCIVVERIFQSLFPHAYRIHVASDILGAAMALCGHEPGIAAILGTGSNSCFYDGKKIIQHTPCLGYILGDEGGSAVMGKLFINAILKKTMPTELCDRFLIETGLTQEAILDKVYRGESPNRFLASFSPFIHEHLDVPEVRNIVVGNFQSFFRNNIRQYGHPEMPVNFVGSTSFHYKDCLQEAAQKEGFIIGNMLKSPIEGLVENII